MKQWYRQVFAPATTRGKWLRAATVVMSFSLLILVLLRGAFSFAPAHASTIIASDSFNRTVTSGWGTADQGGSWSVLTTAANWSVTPGQGIIKVSNTAQEIGVLSAVSVQDVDLLTKIVLPRCSGSGTNCDAYVIGRYTAGTTPTYYRVGIVQGMGNNSILLRSQRSDGSNLSQDVNTGIAATNNAVVQLRVEFQGTNPTTIRARAWLNGTTEPTTWQLNITDTNSAEQKAGGVGVRARNEDTATTHTFQYQSYVVSSLGSSGTPTPTATTALSPTATTPITPTPITPTATPTPGTAASDTFQRTTASGWGSATTGGWWSVVGSPWNWSVSPGTGNVLVTGGGQERAYLSSFTIQNVDIVEQVVLPRCTGSNTNCDAFVLGRYAPAYSPTYYRVGVVQGAGRSDIYLRAQRSDGTNIGSDIDTGIPASNNAVVLLHVQFQGSNPTTIRAHAWLSGTTEPSTWTLNTTDSNGAEQSAGMVGLRFSNEDSSTNHSFQVTSYQATGTATPVTVTPNPTGSTTAHLLYVIDDGEGYVYNIDNNHTLIKQFPIPEAGKRGVAMAPNQGILYLSECGMNNCAGANGSLIAYDLVHDVVDWIANYSFGIDQMAITPDGKTIYMPHGADASDRTTSVLDASDGKVLTSIQTGTNGHNTIVSLDGTQVYLNGYTGSTYNYAHVYSTATNQSILNAGPDINGVRPFTVNGKHTLMFTTSTNTCGFQVLSLTTGSILYTVPFSGSCNWTVSNAPSHGISLSPDEKRVYVMDAPLDQLEVYDVSGLPATGPRFVASIQMTSISGWENPCQTYCEKEGWVLNDLSGQYVYVADTGDVISTSTLKVLTTLPVLQNTRQVIEIDWTNGTTSATSTRFGIGRVTG